MLDARRNRIVIDFNNKLPGSSATRPRGKSRVVKVLLILVLVGIGVLLLVLAGGFFWWQNYKTTPAYSLALLLDAVQRQDVAAVDQVVNADKIAANLTEEISQRAAGRYGLSLDPAARERVESLVPSLMPRVKQSIRDEVIKSLTDASLQKPGRPFFVLALAVPYSVKITNENESAKVGIPNRDTELTLERNGERWQIVAIKDSALVQRIVDRLTEDLPAIAAPVEPRAPGRPPGSRRRRR